MIAASVLRRLPVTLVGLLVALALVGAACSSSDSAASLDIPDLDEISGAEAPPAHGEVAADFTVETLDGDGFTLSEHLEDDGRPVFLNLWASWCPPCRAEMPDIDSASERHQDVKFVGVAVEDDPAASAEFATSIGIGYTIGFDTEDKVAHDYDIVGLPASYIISSEGIILQRFFGAITEEQIDEILERWFS